MNLVMPRMETSGSIIVSSRPALGQVGEDDRHQDDVALDSKIQVVVDPIRLMQFSMILVLWSTARGCAGSGRTSADAS
jgi:hypothetical protein